VNYHFITSQRELTDFCDLIAAEPTIGFDTEFVSEDSFRPDLCLVQVAAGQWLGVIDAQAIEDLTPFWDLLASPGHRTIAHAAREELRFSLRANGRRPHDLFDVQIAAGFIGLEYPAAYNTLVQKLLGETLHKGETRTNWRKRPLSERQIEYALQDVVFLADLHDTLEDRLEAMGRLPWLVDEMQVWQAAVETSDSEEERWRRVGGLTGLSPRSLAIVRDLWRWREIEAEKRNRPARRILRDDLIVELAKRQTADVTRIRAVRGLERGDLQRHIPGIARCIERALETPEEKCPGRLRRQPTPQLGLIGQFLTAALGGICQECQIASSLVGATQDVRDFVAWKLGLPGGGEGLPALSTGWRAEVVGRRIDDLLTGHTVIRIGDPLSDQPLIFEGMGSEPVGRA
jgi:ribonuclease D